MATGGAKNPQANVDPNFLKFQNDIKKTAFGIKFARALFTGGNGALSESFLREGFKQLGLDIPKGVEISISVAQAIAAGSALTDAIDTYEGIDDLRSVTNQTTALIRAGSKIFQSVGWLQKDSDEVQMIQTATNVATLIGSCGMNVQAWVSLALDFTSFEGMNAVKAKQAAAQGLMQNVQARVNPQAKAAADVLKAYQEKKMSTFGFVGRMAEVAPDLWPQYFPNLGWAPVREWRESYTVNRRTWYGSSSGDQTVEYVYKSIAGYSKEQIKAFVFMNLAEPTLFPFYMANQEYAKKNKCSLMTLALLSTMVTGFDYIGEGDLSPLLLQNQVTLSDFEQPMVLQYLEALKNPHLIQKSAGIISGTETEIVGSSASLKEKQRTFVWDNRALFEAADRAGRIDLVARAPELRKVMSDAMTYPGITPNEAYGIWNESNYRTYSRGGSETEQQVASMRLAGPGVGWRSPRNYFAALALIDQLRSDEYFAGWSAPPVIGLDTNGDGVATAITSTRDIGTYDFLGTVEEFETRHREISFKMLIRKVNTMALGNVAYFLGTTPDKLLRVNRDDQTAPAVYDKKG